MSASRTFFPYEERSLVIFWSFQHWQWVQHTWNYAHPPPPTPPRILKEKFEIFDVFRIFPNKGAVDTILRAIWRKTRTQHESLSRMRVKATIFAQWVSLRTGVRFLQDSPFGVFLFFGSGETKEISETGFGEISAISLRVRTIFEIPTEKSLGPFRNLQVLVKLFRKS